MQNIRPSSELRNKYSEISALCKETRDPVYITVNGHGDTVILSLEQFNQIQAELELLKMLSESEEDARNNKIKPINNSFDDIRKKIEL